MKSLHVSIEGESLRTCLSAIFGIWFCVWIYAALHDQYLIRICPEHFTVWLYQILFTKNFTLLAIIYAFGASITPGLVLGLSLYIAGRLFSRPKVPIIRLILSTGRVMLSVEAVALISGIIAWRLKTGIYADWLYPDYSPGIAITQTMQITAYLAGMVFSGVLIWHTWNARHQEAR